MIKKIKHAYEIFYKVFSMNEVKENQKVKQEKRKRGERKKRRKSSTKDSATAKLDLQL